MNNLSSLLQHHQMEPFQNNSLPFWKIQRDTTSTLPAGLCFVACVYSSLSLFDPHGSPTCVEACSEAKNISNLLQAIQSCSHTIPFTHPFLVSCHSNHIQCLSLSLLFAYHTTLFLYTTYINPFPLFQFS